MNMYTQIHTHTHTHTQTHTILQPGSDTPPTHEKQGNKRYVWIIPKNHLG